MCRCRHLNVVDVMTCRWRWGRRIAVVHNTFVRHVVISAFSFRVFVRWTTWFLRGNTSFLSTILRHHTAFLSRVLYWNKCILTRFLRTETSFCQFCLRDVLSFWHDDDDDVSSMSSSPTSWHVVDVDDVETLSCTTRLCEMLAFRHSIFAFLCREHGFLSTVLCVILVFLVCTVYMIQCLGVFRCCAVR